jgi:hypothetical protein
VSGGSSEPESERDVQCQNCGRWYTPKGITGHQPHCPLEGYDAMIVPLEDTTHPLDEDGDPSEKGAPAPSEAEGDAPSPTATDGGETMAPPTFEADDDDLDDDPVDEGDDFDAEAAADEAVDDETDDDPEPIVCPECPDGDMGVTANDLDDGDVVSCESCGVRKRWRAEA